MTTTVWLCLSIREPCVLRSENSVLFLCLHDKDKVPFGEPGQAMSTGVRGRHSLMVGGSQPVALDHDQASKGSLTPSVILECAIPFKPFESFYRGQLHVLVKDTVFQPSTPYRHATELLQVLREKEIVQPVLFLYTDGSGDHRSTYLSVQLSLILLFIQLDLDMVVACRTAPGHSYTNPAERCMATLNLGLQNCAFARNLAATEMEKRFKACSRMDALRKLPDVLQRAWSESVKTVQRAVEKRFNRLIYAEK